MAQCSGRFCALIVEHGEVLDVDDRSTCVAPRQVGGVARTWLKLLLPVTRDKVRVIEVESLNINDYELIERSRSCSW